MHSCQRFIYKEFVSSLCVERLLKVGLNSLDFLLPSLRKTKFQDRNHFFFFFYWLSWCLLLRGQVPAVNCRRGREGRAVVGAAVVSDAHCGSSLG